MSGRKIITLLFIVGISFGVGFIPALQARGGGGGHGGGGGGGGGHFGGGGGGHFGGGGGGHFGGGGEHSFAGHAGVSHAGVSHAGISHAGVSRAGTGTHAAAGHKAGAGTTHAAAAHRGAAATGRRGAVAAGRRGPGWNGGGRFFNRGAGWGRGWWGNWAFIGGIWTLAAITGLALAWPWDYGWPYYYDDVTGDRVAYPRDSDTSQIVLNNTPNEITLHYATSNVTLESGDTLTSDINEHFTVNYGGYTVNVTSTAPYIELADNGDGLDVIPHD